MRKLTLMTSTFLVSLMLSLPAKAYGENCLSKLSKVFKELNERKAYSNTIKLESVWASIDSSELHKIDPQKVAVAIKRYKSDLASKQGKIGIAPRSVEEKIAFIEITQETLPRYGSHDFLHQGLRELTKKREKKFRKFMKSWDLDHWSGHKNLDRFAAELYMILYGAKFDYVKDFIRLDRDNRAAKQLAGLLNRRFLNEGLNGIIAKLPSPYKSSYYKTSKRFAKNLFDTKLGRFLYLPLLFPKIKDKKISDELLVDIFLRGAGRHKTELIPFLRSEKIKSYYRATGQLYAPLAFVGFFTYVYIDFNKQLEIKMQEQQEKAKEEFFNSLDTITEQAKKMSESEKMSPADKQLIRVALKFLEAEGRPLNSSEEEELIFAIYGELSSEEISEKKSLFQQKAES